MAEVEQDVIRIGEPTPLFDEAAMLLTECAYTINALAEQQAMPDDFYMRTLAKVEPVLQRLSDGHHTTSQRIAQLEEALRPFAFLNDIGPWVVKASEPDLSAKGDGLLACSILLSDIKRARAALKEGE
jgi:hypothetical protein